MPERKLSSTICKQKRDYFKEPQCLVKDSRPDQCILIKENLLPHVRDFQYRKSIPGIPEPSTWYPLVNSYYNHAEDVDAFARVNELLAERPSLPSIRSEENNYYDTTDPYSEKDAQLHYLMTKPVCFLILGKPGICQEQLGKKLAEYWRCVYIDPETLINEEIKSGSRAGECIEFNLKCGRAIGIDIILRLIEKRLRSKSVQHRGFVLTGIPVIPNELYEEDPVSSESAVFNVHEIFDEICDAVIEIGIPVTKHVSIISKSKESVSAEEEPVVTEAEEAAEEEEGVIPDIEPRVEDPSEKFLLDVGSTDRNICLKPEISTNCEEQLQFLFNLIENPMILIYIRCENEDVMSKRNDYRYDIYENKVFDIQQLKINNTIRSLFSKEPGSTSYEIPPDLFDEVQHEDISKLTRLVRVPRDFPANVAGQLKLYRANALPTIEQRILFHDPQYFLRIDGRASSNRMFNIIKGRLDVLPLQRVILPEKLNVLEAPTGGGEFEELVEDFKDLTLEECFEKLRRKQILNAMFKWNWSDWGIKCPVAMKEGSYRDGDAHFAVHFMDKIFFLSDEESFWKFYRNPRPYLLPPYPKPSCRIFLFGPNSSGKTTISKCMAYLLNGTVLNVEDMKTEYINRKKLEHKEKVKQAALIEAINILDARRESQRRYRETLIKFWLSKIKSCLNENVRTWRKKLEKVAAIELPAILDLPATEFLSDTTKDTPASNLEFSSEAQCQEYLKGPQNLHKYLPQEIAFDSNIDEPASVLDEFVTTFADRAAEEASIDFTSFTDDNLAEAFKAGIKEVEDNYQEQGNNRGGWIIDGMPINFNLLEMLYPEYIADDVFILEDQDHYLLNNYNQESPPPFRNFRQLFMNMDCVDAAWRSPSTDSTKSVIQKFVRDILYDAIENKYGFSDEEKADENTELPDVSWAKSIETYADHLKQYSEEIMNLIEYFKDKHIVATIITVNDKTIANLCTDVVKAIQNRYRQTAEPLTDEERYAETVDFGNTVELAGEFFEGPTENVEDSFGKNRRYGDTFWYCPVTLKDNWVLWKGREENAVMFENKVYLLATEEDIDTFVNDPKKYVFGNKPPSQVPPSRICVIGNKGLGKTTIARALASNFGVKYVNYQEFLQEDNDVDLEKYLKEDVPLPKEFLLRLINRYWFQEPMKSVGFVLDDFPKRISDLHLMIEYKAIPDIILHVAASEFEAKKRLVDSAMAEYHSRREKEQRLLDDKNDSLYQEWKKRRDERYEELMEERRQSRYTQKLVARSSKQLTASAVSLGTTSKPEITKSEGEFSQVTYESFPEHLDEKEVFKMLDQEMPEPMLEEIPDDSEEMMAQFEETFEQEVNLEASYLLQLKDLCETAQIPYNEVDAHNNEETTVYLAYLTTENIVNRNKSMFERCYDISFDMADQLLSMGYYFLSKFGKTCPVQYYKKLKPIQMYIPEKNRSHLYPVIHRHFIYFLAGADNWMEFKKEPLKYTLVENFNFPLIPYRIAIIGAPKSGKTTLSQKLQQEYAFKVTTCGQAIRYVLQYFPFSKLATSVESTLRSGMNTTDEMQIKCAEAVYYDTNSLTQGIVFDGFPNNEREVAVLRDVGLVPHLILYLKTKDDQVYKNLSSVTETRNLPIIYSLHFFDIRFENWKETFPIFRKWMDREYQNIAEIPTNSSAWYVRSQSQKIFLSVFSEIKHYYTHAHDDWPLRVANMLVTPLEYLERISLYRSFCPCCLGASNTLSGTEEIPDRTNLIHFAKHFYWICDQHIEDFLKTPEKYLAPFNRNLLPKDLPKRVFPSSMPIDLYEEGICMVCYSENKQRKVFTMGVLEFAVEYKGYVYLCDNQECLEKFMSKAHEYADLTICYRDPTNMASLKYNELPVMGFLEQYLARDIIKALNDLVRHRPVVPGLSIQASAAIHIGLYLKMNKEDKQHLKVYQKAESFYIERKEKLVKYLEDMKSFINPYIYYEEPMPRLKKFMPNRTTGDFVRGILFDILHKIDCDKNIYLV